MEIESVVYNASTIIAMQAKRIQNHLVIGRWIERMESVADCIGKL